MTAKMHFYDIAIEIQDQEGFSCITYLSTNFPYNVSVYLLLRLFQTPRHVSLLQSLAPIIICYLSTTTSLCSEPANLLF